MLATFQQRKYPASPLPGASHFQAGYQGGHLDLESRSLEWSPLLERGCGVFPKA